MTAAKIAITVPEDDLRRAKSAVRRGRARSLSAYISDAIREKSMVDELDAMLIEMLKESGGPLTATECQKADAAIFGDAPAPRSRRKSPPRSQESQEKSPAKKKRRRSR